MQNFQALGAPPPDPPNSPPHCKFLATRLLHSQQKQADHLKFGRKLGPEWTKNFSSIFSLNSEGEEIAARLRSICFCFDFVPEPEISLNNPAHLMLNNIMHFNRTLFNRDRVANLPLGLEAIGSKKIFIQVELFVFRNFGKAE